MSLVIDCGSDTCRVGRVGDEQPNLIFKSVIGYPKRQHAPGIEEYYIGDEAYNSQSGEGCQADQLRFQHPIEHGQVSDWDAMEKLLSHAINFDKSYWQNAENGLQVLLTAPPSNPKRNKEKMAEIVFEKLDASGFYVTNSSILALYASGRTTGFVLDSGEGVTNLVPCYEGFTLEMTTKKMYLAGSDVTELLRDQLKPGVILDSSTVKAIKECKGMMSIVLDYEQVVSEDPSEQQQKHGSRPYELPDGSTI